jgi:hypothetical protein
MRELEILELEASGFAGRDMLMISRRLMELPRGQTAQQDSKTSKSSIFHQT